MIIRIEKTSGILNHVYDVYIDGNYYEGKAGRFSKYQSLTMSGDKGTVSAKFRRSPIRDCIPFSHLFGIEREVKRFVCSSSEIKYGMFTHSSVGFNKHRYIIYHGYNKYFFAYYVPHGRQGHICIYDGDEQIAQIETELMAYNCCYKHTLYLLDSRSEHKLLLAMFALYIDNFKYTERGRTVLGSETRWEYSWSEYKYKYDSEWLSKNFSVDQ